MPTLKSFWTPRIYHMCIGAIWGACFTMIALTLSPQLRHLFFTH